MADYFKHPSALVESETIGRGTRIWANVHIMPGVSIGEDCNICDSAFIESGAVLGRGVTVKIGVEICEGVTIEDGVFIGPHVAFTNDLRPRSPRLPELQHRYANKDWLRPTTIERGATIGGNVTLASGLTVGAWAFVAAGSVVMRDVAPFSFVVGNPARPMGYVCVCAEPLTLVDGAAQCSACRRNYKLSGNTLEPQEPISFWK